MEQAKVEGGKKMSDIVLGMIIGGVIGVVGSAAVALIQGHYSLKGKREENLAREQQQSMQIQHEKDSQVLSRRISVSSTYLEPLSSDLCSLFIAVNNYMTELIRVLTPYYTAEERDEIKVPKAAREEFMREINLIQSTYMEIFVPRNKIYEDSARVADRKLTDQLNVLTRNVTAFYDTNSKTLRALYDSGTEEDLVCNFRELMQSIGKVSSLITTVNSCIESLLAGVEEDDE